MAQTIITILTLIALLAVPIVDASAPNTVAQATAEADVRITGGTAADQQLIDDAISRFDHAGMDLPNLVITVHTTDSECKGRTGLYRSGETAATIEICQVSDYVVLHELAHAWEVENVTDSSRDAFLAASGLDTWADTDVKWANRGRERVANVVASVLRSEGPSICDEQKVELFDMITGTDCVTATS